MLKPRYSHTHTHAHAFAAGVSLIEVLVSIVILSFGLLGLASLQGKMHAAEVEAFQRTQALLALSDMSERISANRDAAASYVSTSAIGTGDSQPASCASVAAGPARDLCEWSRLLKGAAEGAANAFGARGCITQVQAPVTSGSCRPGIYEVAVAWQGMLHTAAPPSSCGRGQYGSDDAYRRAMTVRVAVGVPSC
jgi:type IV pilus assembly protein PilV